jgi:hypothetical protein
MHSDKIRLVRGRVTCTKAREKKVPERHSSLCPSEKELPEWFAGMFSHKNTTVYKHEEPWWNDTDRGKLLIRPLELSGNPSSSHITTKQNELAKEIMNFAK